jgi:hypothetical protein
LAPSTPLWFHVLKWAFVGALTFILWFFYTLLQDYLKSSSVADAYRRSSIPLIQYRLEQRHWPEDFDLTKPPEGLNRYDFSKAWEKASGDLTVAGTWRFVQSGAEGKAAITFEPKGVQDAQTFLVALDKRLDDGRPETGRFRVKAGVGSFTLPVE